MTTVNPEYSLNRTFYNALVSRYGFEVPPLLRTPGLFSGVVIQKAKNKLLF